MVAKQVEVESTCSCPQLGLLAEIPTTNLNNQWNLSWYEMSKPRSTEDT